MVDDILKLAQQQGDAGVTVVEIIQARGEVPTQHRRRATQMKLAPLVAQGKLIPGRGIRTNIAGHTTTVPVYRVP